MVPLQAADFLAYETFRFFYDTQLLNRQERWQHIALRRIVWGAYLHDSNSLEAIVAGAERSLVEKGIVLSPQRVKQDISKAPYKPSFKNVIRRAVLGRYRRVRRWIMRLLTP